MKKALISAVILIAIVAAIGFTASQKSQNKPIASLDGQIITKMDLENYVNGILGEKYKKMLSNEDDLKKLAGYYIDRKILLSYAKNNVKDENTILKNHQARKMDTDTMIITALLAQEVNDDITIDRMKVLQTMKERNIKTEEQAIETMKSEERRKRFLALMDKVRKEHDIKIF